MQRGEEEDDGMGTVSRSLRTVGMSFLSNATSYVDGSGVGHVKVNDSMDWSDILPNDTTVHIIYEGSGSNEQVIIIPVHESASNSTDSASSSSSGSGSMSGNSTVNPIDNLPTGSSGDSSSGDGEGVIGTGSTPTTLVIVASVLAIIAIVAVLAVVIYGRRNRRRAYSDDPDEPFIVGSLPHQPAPQLSLLDTDITPDLWVEGQYQYSPNTSGLENSLSGTAILSDNNTISSDHRLTVDAYPFGPNTHRGRRGNAAVGNAQRGRRDNAPVGDSLRGRRDIAPLDDISERGRRRRGTTPVVLYEQDSIEEYKTNSSSKHQQQRQPSRRQRQPSQQQQQQQRQREPPQQERMSRRDKYATRQNR
ncbi:hypothetical protein PHYPSEUDO_005292 [Phytophthora pseudosyringae]|uniref:Uncharacterized protein n=1 Tax=Phytophthora pseudosyringae TaxID=221518 RepID=A0A8T1WHA1_9STRA|nr:hypothetical protein PHYPSEUDO_005292 [Phytophthora pseudosyringae]